MSLPGMTPGPWRVGLSVRGGPWQGWRETDINGPDGCFLLLRQYGEVPEAEANARAIASLPEMVEALDKIDGQAYDAGIYGESEANARLLEIRALARAALAKARGGRDCVGCGAAGSVPWDQGSDYCERCIRSEGGSDAVS